MPKCLLYSACRTYVLCTSLFAAAANLSDCLLCLSAVTLIGWQEGHPVRRNFGHKMLVIAVNLTGPKYPLVTPPAYIKKKRRLQRAFWLSLEDTQCKHDWRLRSRRQPINLDLLGMENGRLNGVCEVCLIFSNPSVEDCKLTTLLAFLFFYASSSPSSFISSK